MGGALGLAILSGVAGSITASATNMSKIQALVTGYDRAFLTAAFFVLFALVLAITVIKKPQKRNAATPQSQQDNYKIRIDNVA